MALLLQIIYLEYPFIDTSLLFSKLVHVDAEEGVRGSTEEAGQRITDLLVETVGGMLAYFPWPLFPGFSGVLRLGKGTLCLEERGQRPLVLDHSVGKALKHGPFPHLGDGPVFVEVDFGPGPVDVARWQWNRQR